MPTSAGRRFQEFRNAKACLDKAQNRLRKGERKRWPFEGDEFEVIKSAVENHAREVLGESEFSRIKYEVAKANLTARTTRGELAKAAEPATTRATIAKVENMATALISRLRKRRDGER